jgi:polar amino acid transport system substrate-binding protein
MKKKSFFTYPIFTIVLFLAVISLFLFTDSLNAGPGADINTIKKAGKLVVGTSADYPPYEFHLLNDKDGELVGIDIDIAKVIAQELGVKLEVKDLIFSRIFDALDSGKIDIAIAGLSPTEERRKVASFSTIYYQAIQSIVIHIDNTDKIKTVEDLRGKKVGTQKDSIQEEMAKTQIQGAKFEIRETIEELVLILRKQLVEAIILEKPVADSYVRQNNKFAAIKCEKFDNVLGSAIAVKKGNKELLKEINRILDKLIKEDKIKDFVQNAKMLTDKH